MLSVGMTVRIARLPEGEDPDSLLRLKGPEAFRECIAHALSIVEFQIDVAGKKEQNPDSYDALTRTARAVLELVKKCPMAVMRAGLMQETAKLLKIPVSALEEDLAKLESPKQFHQKALSDKNQEIQNGNAASESSSREVETQLTDPVNDASSPVNNQPPQSEMALMEFLFGLVGDLQIADLLEAYAPDVIFEHSITGMFIQAFIRETRGEIDAVVNLKKTVQAHEVLLLESVFFSRNRAAISELEPSDNLRKMLSRFWFTAVCRKLLELPKDGDDELMRRRNRLSMLSRKFKSMSWKVACHLMRPELLE
jgi:DNA primase